MIVIHFEFPQDTGRCLRRQPVAEHLETTGFCYAAFGGLASGNSLRGFANRNTLYDSRFLLSVSIFVWHFPYD